MCHVEFVLSVLLAAHAAPFTSLPIRTVALSDQNPPGLSPQARFTGFPDAQIDAKGRVSFMGSIGSHNDSDPTGTSLWAEGGGTLELLAASDLPAPGLPIGSTFNAMTHNNTRMRGSRSGGISFNASVHIPGVGVRESIWSNVRGELRCLAYHAGPAQVVPGMAYYFTLPLENNPVSVSGKGSTAVYMGWTGPTGNAQGLFTEAAGGLIPSVINDPAPGLPGVNLSVSSDHSINGNGRIAFRGSLSGEGVGSSNNTAIWTDASGALSLVARTGTQAADMPDGVHFASLQAPRMNDRGEAVFTATLKGNGINTPNDSGIWKYTEAGLSLVAREGMHAPGMPQDVSLAGLGAAVINGRGETAFSTGLNAGTSPIGAAIWIQRNGHLDLVASSGAASDLPGGVNLHSLEGPLLNIRGDVVFSGYFTEGSLSGKGLWAADPNGALRLLVRTGDLIEVAPGEWQELESFHVGRQVPLSDALGGQEGRGFVFNDAGDLVFTGWLADSRAGVFVLSIPEPAAALLLGLGAGLCTIRPRHRTCRQRGSPTERGHCCWRDVRGRGRRQVRLRLRRRGSIGDVTQKRSTIRQATAPVAVGSLGGVRPFQAACSDSTPRTCRSA